MESVLIFGVAAAATFDWRYRRIPNALTGAMVLSGFMLRGAAGGWSGIQESAAGLFLGILLLLLPFLLGGMGGGDVKLLGAIGALVGPAAVVQVFLSSAVFGGLLSLAQIARSGAWRPTFLSLRDRMVYSLITHKLAAESEISFSRQVLHVPYGLAIACGYLSIYLLGGGK